MNNNTNIEMNENIQNAYIAYMRACTEFVNSYTGASHTSRFHKIFKKYTKKKN
uniref:Uncharacterized protein n=1 Tax=viral metagenome TaxID=1070528 RepID=A0A6C0HNE1_9ZZZZ